MFSQILVPMSTRTFNEWLPTLFQLRISPTVSDHDVLLIDDWYACRVQCGVRHPWKIYMYTFHVLHGFYALHSLSSRFWPCPYSKVLSGKFPIKLQHEFRSSNVWEILLKCIPVTSLSMYLYTQPGWNMRVQHRLIWWNPMLAETEIWDIDDEQRNFRLGNNTYCTDGCQY